jgi:hypothetical protein
MMMNGGATAQPDLPKANPPVGRLLGAITIVGGLVAVVATGAAWLISGSGATAGQTLAAGGVAVVSGWAGSLAVLPWRKRSPMVWPMLILLSTLLVMVFTLSAGLVLHFAARVAEAVPWIGLVAGFWAVLAAMVAVHAGFLRSLQPAGDAGAFRAAEAEEESETRNLGDGD